CPGLGLDDPATAATVTTAHTRDHQSGPDPRRQHPRNGSPHTFLRLNGGVVHRFVAIIHQSASILSIKRAVANFYDAILGYSGTKWREPSGFGSFHWGGVRQTGWRDEDCTAEWAGRRATG